MARVRLRIAAYYEYHGQQNATKATTAQHAHQHESAKIYACHQQQNAVAMVAEYGRQRPQHATEQ